MTPLAELPFPNIDPVIFKIGPFEIGLQLGPIAIQQIGPIAVHWYGLAYVVGILFGWWYAKRLVTNTRLWSDGQSPVTPLDLDDFLLWAALGIVLGGRLGHILFYDFEKYSADPLSVFAVWNGGMSFHGGLTGVILAIIVFSMKRSIPLRSMFDVIACAAPIGIGLVRCTNFINSELWGRVTDVPWAFVFPNGGPEPRHPSQLYEAMLEGFLMFFLLMFLTYRLLKLKTPGFVAGFFVFFYGCSRIFVEFFRVPDKQLGYLFGDWVTMGMILSAPLVLIGIWLMATARPISAQSS